MGGGRLAATMIHERERMEVLPMGWEDEQTVGVERSSSVPEEAQRPPRLSDDRRARGLQFAICSS